MNTANKLTILRVVMIPAFLLVLYLDVPYANYWALAIFAAASITDTLDGYIARQMPAWALLIVIVREFAVSGLRMVAADKGRVIAAGWSGKVKTAATMVCVLLMLLPLPEIVSQIGTAVIVLTTIYSGVEYFMKNADILTEAG